MKRLSTDAEYLNSGKIVLDADGIPVDLTDVPGIPGKADKAYVDSELEKKSDKTHTHLSNDQSTVLVNRADKANLLVRTNSSGALAVDTTGITNGLHVTNKEYVDLQVSGVDTGQGTSVGGGFTLDADGTAVRDVSNPAKVTTWGSSTFNRMADNLSARFLAVGAEYDSQAHEGETGNQMAARMGAIPAIIEPATIRAEGTTKVPSNTLTLNDGMKPSPGTLAGVRGTLWTGWAGVYFAREAPGDAVTLAEPTPFIPDHGPATRGNTTIFNVGKNNMWDEGGGELAVHQLNAMVRFLSPRALRFIVVGHFANTDQLPGSVGYENVELFNAQARDLYGDLFFDHGAVLADPGVWAKAGITPTADDLAAQADRRLPPSLSTDAHHQTDVADEIVADALMAHMRGLGWYGTTEVGTPTGEHTHPMGEVDGLDTALAGKLDASSFLTGNGFPEGKIAAPVGSVYTDSSATNGAIRWVKTSGTQTIGWQVQYGDTGWRNIASLFSNLTSNTSSDRMSIKRSGDIVQLVVHSVAFDKSAVESGSQVIAVPVGFRPARAFRHPIAVPAINLDLSAATGRVSTYGSAIELGASVSFELSWVTNDPWPATLPGTPA